MRRRIRHRWRWVALLTVLGLGGAFAYLRSPASWEQVCSLARDRLPELLNMDVAIGQCELDPLTATVRLRDVSLRARDAKEPLLTVQSAQVTLYTLGPWGAELSNVVLEQPMLVLHLDEKKKGPSAKKQDAKDTCPLDLLEQLDVRQLQLRGGGLRVHLAGGRTVTLRGVEVAWKERRGALDGQVQVREGELSVPGRPALTLSRLHAAGRLDVDDARLELTRGEAAFGDAALNVTGRIEELCSPKFALESQLFLPISTVAKHLALPSPASGHLSAQASISGTPAAPAAMLTLVGSRIVLGQAKPGDFNATVQLTPRSLRLEELRTNAGAGTLIARGAVELTPALPVKLSFETESASFGAVLARAGVPGAWIDFPANGKGSFSGRLLPKPSVKGEIELDTPKLAVTSRAYDEPIGPEDIVFEAAGLHLKTKAELHADRVEFTEASVSSPRSVAHARATLHFSGDKGLDIHSRAEALELSDFGHIVGLEWAGQGSAEARIFGPYGDIQIDGKAAFKNFQFWGFGLGTTQGTVHYGDGELRFGDVTGQQGRSPYRGAVSLRWPQKAPMHVRADASFPDARASDMVELLAGLHPNLARLRGAVDGRANVQLAIDSPVQAFAGEARFDVKDLSFMGRRLGSTRSLLRFEGGERMVLSRTHFDGPLGQLWAQGMFAWNGVLDFQYGGDKIDLAELWGRSSTTGPALDGKLSIRGTYGGDLEHPVASAYLTSSSIFLGGRDFGEAHLEARLKGDELQVWGKPVASANARVNLTYKAPYPFDATLSLAVPELRALIPRGSISRGLSGSLRGTFKLTGALLDSRTLAVKARLDELMLERGGFRGRNSAPVELSYSGGKVEIQAFSFQGPNTELTAAGTASKQALDLSTHGSVDMRLIESFVPPLERTAGKVSLTASLSGTPERPRLVGMAEVFDARGNLRDEPWAFRALNGRVEFSEARILIQEAQATVNEGRAALRGDVRLDKGEVQNLEFGIQLDQVTARVLDDLPALVSGELLVHGKPQKVNVTGSIDLHRFRYAQPLSVESRLSEMLKRRRQSIAPAVPGEKPKEWLFFDVKVASGADVRIDNNLAKAKLQGSVRLTGSNLRPGMLGTVETAAGSQLFYRGNQFAISQATVELRDRNDVDAVFDVHAQTQVREYLVQLHAFGRARDPQVTFSSQPPLSEGDILSLLTIGVTSRDRNNTVGTGAGLAAEALLSASGLDREVQRFLPSGPVLRDLHFHLSTTYNDVTGLVEPTAQLESKFLTERLKLGMAQPVSGRGTRAQAEYRFHDRLSAQAQWDNQTRDTSLGNLGLDLKLRWEVE